MTDVEQQIATAIAHPGSDRINLAQFLAMIFPAKDLAVTLDGGAEAVKINIGALVRENGVVDSFIFGAQTHAHIAGGWQYIR